MIKLKKVTINKYKCIETEQSFDVEDDITVLVGKNESGKTAILEAITKSNPYLEEPFRFDIDKDYPRKHQLLTHDHTSDLIVFEGTFLLSDEIILSISREVGSDPFAERELYISKRYGSEPYEVHGLSADSDSYLDFIFSLSKIEADDQLLDDITSPKTPDHFATMINQLDEEGHQELVENIEKVYGDYSESTSPVLDYIREKLINPIIPKFLYYDQYYELPPEINLHDLMRNEPTGRDAKTSKALVELAGLDIELLLGDDDEKIERALEDASHRLTTTLRTYWKREDAPRIILRMSKASIQRGQPALIIRVENDENEGGLPLQSRSKGFRYFFSFMVWFSRIQEEGNVNYVLLLDEPGLSLHGTAQADLLGFFEDLSKQYQIIYTTHSQFMIDFTKLNRVRTVSNDNKQQGTRISSNLNDGDRDSRFLLEAALGYEVTQSLFISKNNLLVEGMSDLLYISVMSSILHSIGRTGLSHGVICVPAGGLDKVASFIALFRGHGLEIVCILDTFSDKHGKQRIGDLIKRRIIHEQSVRYFDEFADNQGNAADIEDMFEKCEYLQLYNQAFEERRNISLTELDSTVFRITAQIQKILKKHYNHTRPAKLFAEIGGDSEFLSKETLDRFEKMFIEINRRFRD